MQYSQEHLKTMVYAEFGGQTECIMGNSKIENWSVALEGEGSNCFSITQLVGQKKAIIKSAKKNIWE